jgi:Histidine kinase-, DNA gyrase B-, and HSP90-like ATPase
MATNPIYSTTGSESEKIDVRLSYGIVRLFSEGLYASPNKAVEELVANSFDAGARRVAVLLPADFNDQGATIVVVDDGEGMDAAGLKTHWLIGKSLKRALQTRPLGRQQIGKFGIGKLATYVLSNRLTHISKKNGKYYSTSMNFKDVDDRGDEEVEVKTPIKIALRELTEDQAKQALKSWTDLATYQNSGFQLFGSGASKSWTFAILSDLKVPSGIAGAGECIATEISDSAVDGCAECGWGEELCDPGRGTSASVEAPREVGSEIGAYRVASVPGAGWVITQLRAEGETSLKSCDGAETPARDSMADQRRCR